MNIGFASRRRLLGFALAGPLLVAACGGGGQAATRASQAPAAQPSGAAEMAVPSWAMSWKVSIVSPASGSRITANQAPLNLTFTGFQPSCAAGQSPPLRGIGHFHVLIDNSLIDMYCTSPVNVSMRNVKPGEHTLSVVPALSDHMDVMDNMQSIKIDYEPASPLPDIAAAPAGAAPTIKILSPAPGATVSGPFDVRVQVTNLTLTCDLEGKPDVAGYGHWHVNVDTTNSAMNGMATMARMSCTDTMHLTTQGFKSGKHTLIAYLADDQHAPFSPMVAAQVDVNFA